MTARKPADAEYFPTGQGVHVVVSTLSALPERKNQKNKFNRHHICCLESGHVTCVSMYFHKQWIWTNSRSRSWHMINLKDTCRKMFPVDKAGLLRNEDCSRRGTRGQMRLSFAISKQLAAAPADEWLGAQFSRDLRAVTNSNSRLFSSKV